MENWRDTVVSQFANSPIILRLIEDFDAWLDPAALFDEFYTKIWDLETAEGEGLNIWGRIVGVDRVLSFPAAPSYFGFDTGVQDFAPFGQAPFNAGATATKNYTLGDDAYRALIFVKAAANIAETSAPSLNKLLRAIFGARGRCYVNDLGAMRMRYTFEFYLRPYELSILTRAGVVPRPTGVAVSVLQQPPFTTFGFAEAGPRSAAPFGGGVLLRNGAVDAE